MAEPPHIPGYTMLRPLAIRGVAKVWLAQEEPNKTLRAIKCLPPDAHNTPPLLTMFRCEAKVMAQLKHPHICRIHAHDTTPDCTTYSVLDYIGGDTVAALLKRCAAAGIFVPLDVCCEIILGVCSALSHTQRILPGLLHRDISPQNIMLTKVGEPRLIDFGAVSLPEDSALGPARIWGRPSYTSPEQAMGAHGDVRSDVFALGVVLWELLTGRRMFPTSAQDPTTALKQIAAGATQAYPNAAEYRAELSPAWLELLGAALAFAPGDRLSNFQVFGAAVRKLYEGMSVRLGCAGFLESLGG